MNNDYEMRNSDWTSYVCSSDLFVDDTYRRRAITLATNEQVRLFWKKEYPKYSFRYRADGIAPIQNKVGAFLADPKCRFQWSLLGSDRRRVSHRCQYRSEEHTSELQSIMRISYAVFCLKKKNNIH